MSGFTQGPYSIREDKVSCWIDQGALSEEGYLIYQGTEEEPGPVIGVAINPGLSEAQELANARLLASAPELLLACESALARLKPLSGANQRITATVAQLRAALSKAKGEA
jgi:hypothetical protein